MLLQPLQQRPREMDRDREELPFGHAFQKREVNVPHVIGEDVVEVADRLMEMQAEREAKGHSRVGRLRRQGRGSRAEGRVCWELRGGI